MQRTCLRVIVLLTATFFFLPSTKAQQYKQSEKPVSKEPQQQDVSKEEHVVPAEELEKFFEFKGIRGKRTGHTVARRQFRNILFDFDSYNIHRTSYEQLDEIVKAVTTVLGKCPTCTFTIEGHTDNRGGASYNKWLSQQRAEAVRSYITYRSRLDGRRVRAVGFGEERPVASNESEFGRRENRRVEIIRD